MSATFYYFTDPHFMGVSPRSRTDNYFETMCEKLGEIITRANEASAKLLCGGDLFDRHDVAPYVVKHVAHILSRLENGPMEMVIGNHDIYGHNPTVVNRTILGILEATGTVRFLTKEPIYHSKDRLNIQLTGQPYHIHIDKTPEDYHIKKNPDADVAIHIVHGYLVDRPWPKHSSYTLVPDVRTEADYVLTGHEHYGFGKFIRQDGVCFCNPGALGRVKAAMQELTRTPKIARIDVFRDTHGNVKHDLTLENLNSVRLGTEVLDRKRLEEEVEKKRKVQEFIQSVEKNNSLEVIDLSDILDTLATMNNVPERIKEEARKRIESIQARNSYRG